jgi:hypothetical protein
VLPLLFRGKLFRQIVPRIGMAMPLTALPGMGAMFFITVNQVLVRLWARRGRTSDRMWSVSHEGFSCGTGPPATVAMCSEACVVYAAGRPLSPASIGGSDPVVLSKMIQYRIVLGLVVWCLVSVVRQRPTDH